MADGRSEPRTGLVFDDAEDLIMLRIALAPNPTPRAQMMADRIDDALTRLRRKQRRTKPQSALDTEGVLT